MSHLGITSSSIHLHCSCFLGGQTLGSLVRAAIPQVEALVRRGAPRHLGATRVPTVPGARTKKKRKKRKKKRKKKKESWKEGEEKIKGKQDERGKLPLYNYIIL